MFQFFSTYRVVNIQNIWSRIWWLNCIFMQFTWARIKIDCPWYDNSRKLFRFSVPLFFRTLYHGCRRIERSFVMVKNWSSWEYFWLLFLAETSLLWEKVFGKWKGHNNKVSKNFCWPHESLSKLRITSLYLILNKISILKSIYCRPKRKRAYYLRPEKNHRRLRDW